MLYISSKINDLNSQVLSTSVFLERITTSKKQEVTETGSFTPFQWFPFKAIPIFTALLRKKIVMALGLWTADQVRCKGRVHWVSYGTDTNLPQLDCDVWNGDTDYGNMHLREHEGIQHFDRNLTVIKTHSDDIRTYHLHT